MPIILRRREQSESKPTSRFRDTIGDRLVAGTVVAVFMFCSCLVPWRSGFSSTFKEKLSAIGFVGGFIVGDRINLDRIIPL